MGIRRPGPRGGVSPGGIRRFCRPSGLHWHGALTGIVCGQCTTPRAFDGYAFSNVVRRLYHFGRSVSDLAQACRLMGEGAYDRLHAGYVAFWKGVAVER